jgi:photosystem II stability/assembly factor-like uncharacterized protein
MAICPSDPRYLALCIDTAAVYISKDGGDSWQFKRQGIKSNGVQSVAFDPRNPNILWAAGLNGGQSDPLADGIYHSIDCGESWQLLHNAAYQEVHAQNEYFAFDPDSFDGTQHQTVYTTTHNEGILKTTDAGKNWQQLPGFSNTVIHAIILATELDPSHHFVLFVAADTGLFRSDDGGASFNPVGGNLPATVTVSGTPVPGTPVYGLAVNAKDPNVLYVAIGDQGIWRSTDGGNTFLPRMNGIPQWAFSQHWPWLRLCISPAEPMQLYADAQWGGAFPYHSNDGGASWHAPSLREATFFDVDPSNPGHWWTEGFVAHPTDPKIAFHMNPVRKTLDGGMSWKYASEGVSSFRRDSHTSIAFHPDDPQKMVLFHADWGSALTTDGGDTFTYLPPPRPTWIPNSAYTMHVGAYEPTHGSRRLISAVGGWYQQEICVSDDDCQSWKIQGEDTLGYYQFLAFHPQHPNIVYAGRDSDSLRSINGGLPGSWGPLQYPIKAMFAGNGDIVYAPHQTATLEWEILRSQDQGNTWKALPGKIISSTFTNRDLDVDPEDPDRVYAAVDSGIWVFEGNGWSLRDEHNGLERNFFGDLCFRTIAVDPTRPSIIYSGQCESWRGVARGIFRSTDYGDHWENITGNLGPDLTVWAITVSPYDGTVWLGTDYGNWRNLPKL